MSIVFLSKKIFQAEDSFDLIRKPFCKIDKNWLFTKLERYVQLEKKSGFGHLERDYKINY
uniref:Uncharacterized protein n=1 Tax=Strigamia maritima TaxID=126957 RepID=T1JNJ6_STRMM